MKMMNKVGALLLSAVLCIGMAAPAFAYGGEPVEEVEQPVLTDSSEEDAVCQDRLLYFLDRLAAVGKCGNCHTDTQYCRQQQCAKFFNHHFRCPPPQILRQPQTA